MAIVAALLAASLATAPLRFAEAVRLAPGPATLGQLADLSGLPAGLREQAAGLPLVTIGAQRTRLELDAQWLAARARALMPVLEPWTHAVGAGQVQVVVARPDGGGLAPKVCGRLDVPLEPGEAPARADLALVPCTPGAITDAFSYSLGDGLARARRSLIAGTVIADPPLGSMAALRPGGPAQLSAQVGPVRIERSVEVVRAARPGARTFVRTQDGRIFAAEPEGPRP